MSKGTKHAGDWKETTLQVAINALRLTMHTRKIMANPKVFNPAVDWCSSTMSEINRTVLHIYLNIMRANRIDLRKQPYRKAERLEKQENAIALCNDAYSLFELAKHQFHLDSGKFWYWAGLLYEVETKLSAWYEKDKERYKDI